jgi:hypothetical protein
VRLGSVSFLPAFVSLSIILRITGVHSCQLLGAKLLLALLIHLIREWARCPIVQMEKTEACRD